MPLLHEQHFRAVENLVYEWARAVDENRVEDICNLLAPQGRYRVQSRFNADRGLPHSLIDAHSPANIYEPHHYRHQTSGVQIVGGSGSLLEVRSNFLVVRTMDLDGDMKVFATGQCEDVVDVGGPQPLFQSRHFKLDSRVVETLLVIPL
jgi:anthranilate 1,2-dioxygenase small subunit